jgi:hypothetical protein
LAKKKKTEKAPREMTRRQISAHRRQLRRQRIIFFGGIIVIAAIVLVIIAGWLTSQYIPLHTTVISVNGTRFNTGDFIAYLEVEGISLQASGQSSQDMSTVASTALQQLPKAELMRQAAEQLGVTVNDQDVKDLLKEANLPVNAGSLAYVRTSLLQDKMKTDYFANEVPVSENQVWSNVMFLESDEQAAQIREQIVASDNFTGLASEYALNYYSQNVNSGDFGWHPREVLYDQLGSYVPVDFAFSADNGTLSQPLDDPEMYKQKGYWLIKALEPPTAESANVDAIFVSSRVLANELRPQLESTDNISAIADNYTQYSASKEAHGHMGMVFKSTMTDAFNNYVFSDNVVLGVWSQPIPDTDLWTQGGAWLVRVVNKAANMDLTQDDRDYLENKLFNAWYQAIDTSTGDVNVDGLTDKLQQFAIDRASNFILDYKR